MGWVRNLITAWKVRKAIKKVGGIKGMKSGWKTSEFWGKAVVQVLAVVGALKGVIDPEMATLVAGIVEGLYAIGRSIVKYKGGDLPPLKR